jgi:DNA-directed RNA polymerase specialized sigma24 family protein
MRRPNRHNATRDTFVLDLRERHGLRMREIAALIGVSRPRAHQLLERARYARLVARKRAA